jgi:uncharacterized protein YecA (UPF0149 family)
MNLLELLFGVEKTEAGPQPPAVLPGRNEPCWCGSNKKYKACHMQQDEARRELNAERKRACTQFT